MKAYRKGRGLAPPILNLNIRWRWLVSFTSWPLYSQVKDSRAYWWGWLGSSAVFLKIFKRTFLFTTSVSYGKDYVLWYCLLQSYRNVMNGVMAWQPFSWSMDWAWKANRMVSLWYTLVEFSQRRSLSITTKYFRWPATTLSWYCRLRKETSRTCVFHLVDVCRILGPILKYVPRFCRMVLKIV